MKIAFIDIRKFRSVDRCKIQLDLINAIVGQNNSGKSALIRAMNAFFNSDKEETFFYQGKHNYTSKSIPKITVGFNGLIGNADLKEYSNGDELELQLSYQSSSKRLTYKYKKDNKYIAAPDELIEKIKKNIAFVYIPPNRNPEQLKWEV